MSEIIKNRIDKIESDMRYLRYLQTTSTKAEGCKPACRPEKRPRADHVAYVKPPPAKQKPLTNYIRVSKPAFVSGVWNHGVTPPGKDVDPTCDIRCQAPCVPSRPYVEPPFVQTSRPQYVDHSSRGPHADPPCAQSCRAPCMENSRRPAPIYKDLTMPSRKLPLVDNCTSRRPRGLEDTCGSELRKGLKVVDDPPCLPTCTKGCSEVVHCRPTSSERRRRHKTGHSPSGHSPTKKLSEAELQATDKKMRELEDRMRESSEKLRESEAQRAETEEKLRAAELAAAQSEERLRALEASLSELEEKLRAAERENEKLRTSLDTSRAASRRNSEAQSMALDLATKIADKYKAASAERVEALGQIDSLKAEGEALLQRLQAAEQKAAALEQQTQKPHEDCQELLAMQSAEADRLKQTMKDLEARALAAERGSAEVEELKREAASSMRRAAEAEARAEAERARAEQAAQRAKLLEEESRVADERANEAENDARDARQRAKDAEQRAEDLEAASDDQRKSGTRAASTGRKRKCQCRSRSRKPGEVVDVLKQPQMIDYRSTRRHKCCLCCCRKHEIPRPQEYPLAYRLDIR